MMDSFLTHFMYNVSHTHKHTRSYANIHHSQTFDYNILSIICLCFAWNTISIKMCCVDSGLYHNNEKRTKKKEFGPFFRLIKHVLDRQGYTHSHMCPKNWLFHTMLYNSPISLHQNIVNDVEVMTNTYAMTVNDLFDCLFRWFVLSLANCPMSCVCYVTASNFHFKAKLFRLSFSPRTSAHRVLYILR